MLTICSMEEESNRREAPSFFVFLVFQLGEKDFGQWADAASICSVEKNGFRISCYNSDALFQGFRVLFLNSTEGQKGNGYVLRYIFEC